MCGMYGYADINVHVCVMENKDPLPSFRVRCKEPGMPALRTWGQLDGIRAGRPGSHLAPLWGVGRGPCMLKPIFHSKHRYVMHNVLRQIYHHPHNFNHSWPLPLISKLFSPRICTLLIQLDCFCIDFTSFYMPKAIHKLAFT